MGEGAIVSVCCIHQSKSVVDKNNRRVFRIVWSSYSANCLALIRFEFRRFQVCFYACDGVFMVFDD